MDSQALEATIRTQGEVWFASREIGRLADTESYILNTALYYALNLATGRYVDTEFEPTYIADTAAVADEVYISPAAPVGQVGDAPERTNFITSTYNTSDDYYVTANLPAEENPDQKKNLPSYGRRRVLGHGNFLRCYLVPLSRDAETLQARLPQYIRLGKKRGKARVETRLLSAETRSGAYELGHPIGAYDSAKMPTGNLITKQMRPTPLIVQADYEGEYIAIRVDKDAALDNGDDVAGNAVGDREEHVRFPADVTFLKKKR